MKLPKLPDDALTIIASGYAGSTNSLRDRGWWGRSGKSGVRANRS